MEVCGDFQLSLVVNNTHDLGRHLLCSSVDTIIMMGSMYQ